MRAWTHPWPWCTRTSPGHAIRHVLASSRRQPHLLSMLLLQPPWQTLLLLQRPWLWPCRPPQLPFPALYVKMLNQFNSRIFIQNNNHVCPTQPYVEIDYLVHGFSKTNMCFIYLTYTASVLIATVFTQTLELPSPPRKYEGFWNGPNFQAPGHLDPGADASPVTEMVSSLRSPLQPFQRTEKN